LILLTRSRTVGLPFSYIYIIDEKLVRRKEESKKEKKLMEGAAQSLLSNAGQLVGDEFRQLRGEVARLRNELAIINALLRMQSEAGEGAVSQVVREWTKQLREVRYDAEDCIDLYLLRVRSRPGDRCFVRWKRLLGTLWSRRRLAGDIRDVRALASDISDQLARYGIRLEPRLMGRTAASSSGGTVQAVAVSSAPPFRPGDNDDDDDCNQFVDNRGLALDLFYKVRALANDDDKQLKVFSICGFGGLGKTTLAMEVCRLLEMEFLWQARVSVSQTFSAKDLQGLLKRLLRQIALPNLQAVPQQVDPLGNNIDTMDVGQLENKLKDTLDNKRYSSTHRT
jgi:disease resistance protein RPM1